jgi:predicted ATP-grasp superfamily ATP-dependent carboligase
MSDATSSLVNGGREAFRRVAESLDRWLGGLSPAKRLAVVLGGSCNGLSFARSLGRRGVPTLVLESESFLGTYTRYAKVARLPPVEQFGEEWLALLGSVGARLAAPGILFSTSDAHSVFVVRHAAALERFFRFLLPDRETLERILDKRSQYEAARAAGIPIPAVHFPESSEEADRLGAELPYPCLLKPYDSQSARAKLGAKVVVVGSKTELRSAYERIIRMGVRVMIQEIIPGEDGDLFGYLAFWDGVEGERAWLTKRKLRQYPPGFGDGSLQETVEAPEVARLSRLLLQAFGYRGFVGVEFKRDPRDGGCRLMEINARTVSGNELAIRAGVDFPWIGYQYLTGGTLEPAVFRRGVRYVNEEWDVQAYLSLRQAGVLRLGDWLASLRGVEAQAFAAWDDPLPLLVGLWRFRSLLGSRLASRLRGSKP